MIQKHLSEGELCTQLKHAQDLVEVGAVYAHYRDSNSRYRVTGLVIIEATQEPGVLYRKESGSEALHSITWLRPLQSWIEEADSGIVRFQKF